MNAPRRRSNISTTFADSPYYSIYIYMGTLLLLHTNMYNISGESSLDSLRVETGETSGRFN